MKKNLKLKKRLILLVYIFLTIVIILSIIYITKFFLIRKEAIEESNLLNSIEMENTIEEILEKEQTEIEENDQEPNEESNEKNTITVIEKVVTERMLKVEKLQEENEDIVGWIEIKDTKINYPVLQGDNNEYYLTHNYKKQKSEKGSIFLSSDYDWSLPSSNLLIYGHNIKNGQMFQELLKYEKEEFYAEHPIIRLTTEKEDIEFEIFSVFKSRVFFKSEKNVFRYYNFINADSEDEYMEFVKNMVTSLLH